MSEMYLPGATTLGIICKDGIILASEKRVTYGRMIMSKSGKKVFKLTETIGIACAGIMADMQILAREIGAYVNLFELENKRKISVKATAKFVSNILFERRMFPYFAQTIIGGVDIEGSNLFVLDPLGSLIPDNFAAVGSGAEIAIGVLEDSYKDGLSLEEGRDLVIRAMKSALARDAASGNGIDILQISKEGMKEETMILQSIL